MFHVTNIHQALLCYKGNYQANFYWCPCLDLLKVVILTPWCTFKATQMMVLCRWYESLCWQYKSQVCIGQISCSRNLAYSSGTNLTQDEIKSLEKTWFVLNKQQPIFPQSLFEGESSIPINRPMDEMSWPTSHNGKVVHCIMPFKMSNLHYNGGRLINFLKQL
jgi:hypothetical protein